MHHLNKRNILSILHFSTIFFPRQTSADEFSTTECHCLGIYNKIPNNHGLLSLSYYNAPSKTTGYVDVPCEKGGCDPRKGGGSVLCGTTAHKEPGGREGDEAAFPGEEGFCYRNRKATKKKDRGQEVLFPVRGVTELLPRVERDDEGVDDGETDDYISDDDYFEEDFDNYSDAEAQDGEEEHEDDEEVEEPFASDPLPNTASPSSSNTTLPPSISNSTNWQPLSHKTTRRLNSKSVCVDVCHRYYGYAIPDCGTYVLPGPGRGKGRARGMLWKNKCKKTTWRKVPDVDTLAGKEGVSE